MGQLLPALRRAALRTLHTSHFLPIGLYLRHGVRTTSHPLPRLHFVIGDERQPPSFTTGVILQGNVNMQLPNLWLWEMIDEFCYQFQSFCTYRSKLGNRSAEEVELLKACGEKARAISPLSRSEHIGYRQSPGTASATCRRTLSRGAPL